MGTYSQLQIIAYNGYSPARDATMIVRDTEDLKANGSYREKEGAWSSARYLLSADQAGFTLTQTTVAAGTRQTFEYKNHKEANLIIDGQGNVTDETTGKVYALKPGSMYMLDKHEKHTIEAQTDMRLVCVFTPALIGPETHDEEGSYPLLAES